MSTKKLKTPEVDYRDVADVLARVIDDRVERENSTNGPFLWSKRGHKANVGEAGWNFIPMRSLVLATTFQVAFKAAVGKNFVDAGCGPGETLSVAKATGFHAEGVELNPIHVRKAKRKGFLVHECDLRTFDYSPYNVVYAYEPLKEGWVEFCISLEKMPVGTVLISACGPWYLSEGGRKCWERVPAPAELCGFSGMIIKRIL